MGTEEEGERGWGGERAGEKVSEPRFGADIKTPPQGSAVKRGERCRESVEPQTDGQKVGLKFNQKFILEIKKKIHQQRREFCRTKQRGFFMFNHSVLCVTWF